MKLIYFYLKKCYEVNFNLSINLSEDIFIESHSDGKFKITNINSDIPIDFYGGNIENVTAIVGQNGIGKSTVLNILGLRRHDIYACYPDSQWIAIYESNNAYYLEGFNVKEILGIDSLATPSSYIAYKLNKKNDYLTLDSFIQNDLEIQDKYCVIHAPDLTNNTNASRRLNKNENDDRNIGFKRNYINTNIASFYEFITDNSGNFCSNLSKKFIALKINKTIDDTSKEIYFYTDIDRYLNESINFFKNKENKINKINNNRHIFIINLLEEYILTILNAAFEEETKLSLTDEIKQNPYDGDLLNYHAIKKHLLNLICILNNVLVMKSDEAVKYIRNPDFEYIFNFFENNDNIMFTKTEMVNPTDITCNIKLEQYNKDTYDFISYFCNFILPISARLPEMSSGESDINNKISGINSAIKLTIDSNPDTRGFVLILDEYDEHLHPEWSRIFLSYLLKYLHERYNSYQFQIIISTHSPYIISDLLKENIIKIERDTETDIYSSKKSTKGFASNIYDIINDSFFLSQPIGEFAINKINSVLNAINDNENKISYKTLYSIINVIDDDHIRKILLNELNEKYHSNEELELDEIEYEIELLKNKKEKLLAKKESTHD